MFIVSAMGEEGVVANKEESVRGDGSSVDEQVRKKARRTVSLSPETTNSNGTTISLYVDVNASPLASPRRLSFSRRSPIAAVDTIGGGIADETGQAGENEEPFVIARKLLRRRHVRKEQIRKERKARKDREIRERRYGRKNRSNRESRLSGMSGPFVTPHAVITISLPQLSPMLSKPDSFSNFTQGTFRHHNVRRVNEPWPVEAGDSPKAANLPVSGQSSVTPDKVPLAFISFPQKMNGPATMPRVSFSPLRPRGNM